MIRRFSTAVAVLSVAAAASAQTLSSRVASFDVGGVAYTMPLPTGFCLPSGELVAVARTVAAADSSNVTDLTLYRCDATAKDLGDYTLIKTPKNLVSLNVDQATFAKLVAPQFDKPMPVSDAEVTAKVADDYDRTIGQRPTIGLKLATHGHDETCGYMSGSGTVGQRAVSRALALGGCMTAIGGRVIQVIRYTDYKSSTDEDRMMREARAIAITIKATGGK